MNSDFDDAFGGPPDGYAHAAGVDPLLIMLMIVLGLVAAGFVGLIVYLGRRRGLKRLRAERAASAEAIYASVRRHLDKALASPGGAMLERGREVADVIEARLGFVLALKARPGRLIAALDEALAGRTAKPQAGPAPVRVKRALPTETHYLEVWKALQELNRIWEDKPRVLAMIVEQFRQPQRFLAAARRARARGKTIVLLHPGKSRAARDSAATHTGAMAGDYQVMRAWVERAGVVFAETLEELGDIAEIALRCPAIPSGGAAVLGESGAFKALTLDLCEDLGLDLPVITDQNSPALRAALPAFVGVSNPLDITAQGLVDPDIYRRTLEALFQDDRFGCVVAGIIQTDQVTLGIKTPPILAALDEGKPGEPVIVA